MLNWKILKFLSILRMTLCDFHAQPATFQVLKKVIYLGVVS